MKTIFFPVVDSEQIWKMNIDKVLPNIRKTWPHVQFKQHTNKLIVQNDNVKHYSFWGDWKFSKELVAGDLYIWIFKHLPNSLDVNLLDLGFFIYPVASKWSENAQILRLDWSVWKRFLPVRFDNFIKLACDLVAVHVKNYEDRWLQPQPNALHGKEQSEVQ